MPARGTTSARKRFWLGIYSRAMAVGPDAKQDLVLDWVAKHPDLWQYRYPELPDEKTAKGYLTQLGRADPDLDSDWGLAVLSAKRFVSDFAPDALPTVLAVWRRALVGGRRLTIRQARWVARLRLLVAESDFSDTRWAQLYSFAVLYAAQERAADTLNEPLRTDALDAMLAFHDPADAPPGAYAALWGTRAVAIAIGDVPRQVAKDVPWSEQVINTPETQRLADQIAAVVYKDRDLFSPLIKDWWLLQAALIGARSLVRWQVWQEADENARFELLHDLCKSVVDGDWDAYRQNAWAIDKEDGSDGQA